MLGSQVSGESMDLQGHGSVIFTLVMYACV